MNICIVHPRVTSESSRILAEALECHRENPYDTDRRDFSQYDIVFNYGGSYNIKAKKQINSRNAVLLCKDKLATFRKLEGQVPIPQYTTQYNRELFDSWEMVCCRETVDGNKNEGMIALLPSDPAFPRNYPLYTQWLYYEREIRVVVFKGRVLGVYKKIDVDGHWHLTRVPLNNYKNIQADCIKAANILGIDYVGFDVILNSDKQYAFLEANSGPVITEEVTDYFSWYFQ